MLHVGRFATKSCQGITRREVLQAGGVSALGLTLADAWRPPPAGASPSAGSRDVSCIFIFLSGGPSHLETFDPKPSAPVNVRGPYGAISTNAPGVQISQLLPMIAGHMDKCALVRSMTSRSGDHDGTFVLSGGSKARASYGAVLARLQAGSPQRMPPFVHAGPSG